MQSLWQRQALGLAVIVLLVALAGGVYWIMTRPLTVGSAAAATPAKGPAAPRPAGAPHPMEVAFRTWAEREPDLVLLLSGQLYGYLQPCGCARPQVGGLERRFEALKQLKARGWPVSAVDLGDLAAKRDDPSTRGLAEQQRLKFETAIQMLHKMDYAALGLGIQEIALPLEEALGRAQNYQPPYVLAANLVDKESRYPDMFRSYTVQEVPARPGQPPFRVGYIGVLGNKAIEKARSIDSTLEFQPPVKVLPGMIRRLQEQRADVLVLILQGLQDEARDLAQILPQFHVILHEDDVDEPTALPGRVGDTLLVALGHKGKFVGLVGVNRPETPGGPLALRYQLVRMSEHLEPPADQGNVIRELMKDYVLGVQRSDFIAKWPRGSHPLQVEFPEARYAGAESCKECHRSAYQTWSGTKHARAFEYLEKEGQPAAMLERRGEKPLRVGRGSDPECARCHTTGFEYRGGYGDPRVDPKLRALLEGNGCENCHGPASLHVAHPKDPKYSKPLHLEIGKVEYACRKCHDGDNDPHFKLDAYWPHIKHGLD